MTRSQASVFASLAACGLVLAGSAMPRAQKDAGPQVEKTYGEGLPQRPRLD